MILYLHWKDLRTYDLDAWDYIKESGKPVMQLLILESARFPDSSRNSHSAAGFLTYVNRLIRLYKQEGRNLLVCYGEPAAILERALELYPIHELVWHQEWTPCAMERDRLIEELARKKGVNTTPFAPQTLIHLEDFQRFSGRNDPYKVFTPFYRKWREYLSLYNRPMGEAQLQELTEAPVVGRALLDAFPLPFELELYGEPPGEEPEDRLLRFTDERLSGYAVMRDRYALDETSGLSGAINSGALSVRLAYDTASSSPVGESWVRQLAWRDFYIYQARYDTDFFQYESLYDLSILSGKHLTAWVQAETGIPLVDAAMTELGETGQMPNRLRMVTAMFLTKNLLCPFTLGEEIFSRQLADFHPVLNRGGWLWSASLGFDSAPYFRIMNPVSQSGQHDPSGAYIRRWLPRLKHLDDRDIHLPQPGAIVDLKASRARAIGVYKDLLSSRKLFKDRSGIENP
jgi:deoxyribodipyrimidine photo-lyase